ncbi:hypothetical protein LOZ12_001945 [Ophidiomyces ophidiicola]|uniref:Uncharacterized protein n=1 Tax=Ophidiomyces ophidiicola TaxID=1387563 RepID=A0ACB8USC6_9EURO|nr:uncharacterized protein LOZ57_004575 [Ophidiomyces ophidiicola]KAI1909519.1 hypothetical protein LOZ61_004959 [Ophidiomyces ophidiicola]KAI1912670.1 hypothetical protein LOZ64_004380 [Ophidiomyces ophidiicola]KAI1923588.1 hypothetical protein LOZ60_005122 [Ophidiomyces ophidiicola]KAI1944902.1 hypothetical protein LOZ57_004575 [Ophidiomyces ophidiicola]KAI1954585.1 hypothetical protein LOZ59_004873 [Ophidiomyces ophidiicola]
MAGNTVFSDTTQRQSSSLFDSIVDNSELEALGMSSTRKQQERDLGSRISEWLNREEKASLYMSTKKISVRKRRTMFVVSFGTWDLWKLAEQDIEMAQSSAERIVDKLFIHLNNLAIKWSTSDTKVILSLPVDMTFLPAFKVRQGVNQKDAILLLEHWHERVRGYAEQWQHGSLFLLDANSFVIDQVRRRQLWVGGLINNEEFGKDGVAWENVDEPCVNVTQLPPKQSHCSNPEKFLFWDSLHLGPAAQKSLATEVFHAVNGSWLAEQSPLAGQQ